MKKKKLIVIIAGVVLAAIVATFAVIQYVFKADKIEFVGGTHYTDEELTEYLFGKDDINLLFFKLFGDKDVDVAFIEQYDIEYNWPNKLYVTVYEKAIVGYINYMGCNMYFDKDGIVVESSLEEYENVPEIDGLKFDSIVLGKRLEVGNTDVFDVVLDLTQSFDKYEIDVDKVYFDSSFNVYLYIGDVRVSLGQGRDFTDKLSELKNLSAKFGSLKGTLYMDEYNGDQSSIIFKKEK